jgi:hypothetical protein
LAARRACSAAPRPSKCTCKRVHIKAGIAGLLLTGMQWAMAQGVPPQTMLAPDASGQSRFPQTGAADRTVATGNTQTGDGTMVKLLRMIAPDEDKPLTGKERFHAYLMDTIGPVRLFGEAASAGVEEWADSPKEWREGAAGFAERFGNNLAYNGMRSSLTYGTSLLFHEDNRYFASGRGTVWGRVKHALISPVVARRDDGSETVSFSSLTGVVGAATISRAWAPPSWQGGTNIGRSVGFTFAGMAAVNLVREFIPDIIERIHK